MGEPNQSPSQVQETRANLGTGLWEAICERCRRSWRTWQRRKRPVNNPRQKYTPFQDGTGQMEFA